jgi:succinyl-diaminopimelate desuccinylase
MLQAPRDPDIQRLHLWIDDHEQELITALQGVLRIPSVRADPAPNAPFGQPVHDALDYTLALSEQLGFCTRDVAGYAGHAEFGDGPEMIAALGHLDVVAEGDGWQHDPYGAVVEGGYIYGRGSFDAKGPAYAALFAAKALLDSGLPLKRRVRVIFGCNEESGMECVKHYWEVAREERPVCAFTADGWFPLVYAQKGYARLVLEKPLPQGDFPLRVARASCGVPEVASNHAEAHLVGSCAALDQAAVRLQAHWDRNVSCEPCDQGLLVRAEGRTGHLLNSGWRLTGDDSAAARLGRALSLLDLPEQDIWIDFVVDTVDPTGAALGIAVRDDVTGPLTTELDRLEYPGDGRVRLTYTIRYPATWSFGRVLEANRAVREARGWTVAEYYDRPAHHVPLQEEPIPTLLRIYQEETGDIQSQPLTMIGGSYIAAIPHCVAYGPAFPDLPEGPAHQPEERLAVSTLKAAAKIYAHALYELARGPRE